MLSEVREGMLLERAGYEITEDLSDISENPSYEDAMALSARLLDSFAAGEIGEIYLAYTSFKNTVSHDPVLLKLLPVEYQETEEKEDMGRALMNFEPEDEAALDMIIPKYITSLIYGGLNEGYRQRKRRENAAMTMPRRMRRK